MDLRAFRESRGLSQDQAAAELGLAGKSYISGIETGQQRPSIRLALQIEAWSVGAVRAIDLLGPDDVGLLRGALERHGALSSVAA